MLPAASVNIAPPEVSAALLLTMTSAYSIVSAAPLKTAGAKAAPLKLLGTQA